MPTRDTKDDLQIKVSAAATPARVLIAAKMMHAALQAADARLPEDAVTMVVDNYNMAVEMRPQVRAGHKAMAKIRRVMVNPLKEVQQHPTSQIVADVLSREAAGLAPLGTHVFDARSKKHLATIDKKFIEVLTAAGRHDLNAGDFLDGRTEFHTFVYRVGRPEKGPRVTARIQVDGSLHEVKVAASDELVVRLFDYARDKKTVRIGTACRWLRGDDGGWEFDLREMTIVSAEEMDPASGQQLLGDLTSVSSRTAAETREWLDDFLGDT